LGTTALPIFRLATRGNHHPRVLAFLIIFIATAFLLWFIFEAKASSDLNFRNHDLKIVAMKMCHALAKCVAHEFYKLFEGAPRHTYFFNSRDFFIEFCYIII